MVGFAIGEAVWLPPPGVAGGPSGWNPLNCSSWVGVAPAPWLGEDPAGVAVDFFLIRTRYENQIRKFQPNSIQKIYSHYPVLGLYSMLAFWRAPAAALIMVEASACL